MNQNDTTRQTIILGALLHDIGKFAQRAGEKLDDKGKKDAQIFCPKDKFGNPTNIHVIFSERFIKESVGKKWEKAGNFALRHHKPETYEDKIIELADWLSCGERRKRTQDEMSDKIEVKEEPLINIFSQIRIQEEGKIKEVGEYYCPVRNLNNSLEGLFPVNRKEEALSQDPNKENSFAFQWNNFCRQSKEINKDGPDFEILLMRLFFLLEKYTLFIPSSAYEDRPEISLFHHLKSTAAIAVCLYDLNLTPDFLDKMISAYRLKDLPELKRDDFILLGGDISGIQDFIYSVTSEDALRGLRGRSFYLQLLSEVIAQNILDEFNLNITNLLFSGGGHFTIILPNTEKFKERIDRLIEEINFKIFNAHKGRLGVITSYVSFSYKDFYIDNFGEVIERLGRNLIREKQRKFKEILNYEIFKPYPYEIRKELSACQICTEEIEEIKDKCFLCESFENLSIKIKNAKFIKIKRQDKKSVDKVAPSWSRLLEGFGYNFDFIDNKDLGKTSSGNLSFLLNDTEFLDKNFVGYRFEAIYSPEGVLEDIAKKADGIKHWGALRMDVDNLGKIFQTGLPNKTISRFNMLSHMFSLFFSVRVRYIVDSEFKDKACIVYSGGDDLFILGAWSALPEIAKKIYDDFRRFTCHHPGITLSCGIYLAPSNKFPVYQSAKEAGEAIEKAKAQGKDKITFFDTPLKWKELEDLEEVKDKIVELLEGEKMPRALLTMLYSSWEDVKLAKENKISMPRIWRLLYGLRRLVDRYLKGSEEQMKLAQELRNIFIVDKELKPNLNIAVRWAEYLTREM